MTGKNELYQLLGGPQDGAFVSIAVSCPLDALYVPSELKGSSPHVPYVVSPSSKFPHKYVLDESRGLYTYRGRKKR